MARSIGKRNITKLNAIVDEECQRVGFGQAAWDAIEKRIPAAWYEIWESAHDEIYMLIGDRVAHNAYERK